MFQDSTWRPTALHATTKRSSPEDNSRQSAALPTSMPPRKLTTFSRPSARRLRLRHMFIDFLPPSHAFDLPAWPEQMHVIAKVATRALGGGLMSDAPPTTAGLSTTPPRKTRRSSIPSPGKF